MCSSDLRAAAECERALMLDPGGAEVLLALGSLATSTGQRDVALRHFEGVLALKPESFDARLGIARVHHDAGHYELAEAVCKAAIQSAPEDWRGHSLLGSIHFRSGRYEQALAPWNRVLELTPDNTRGHRNLGNAFYCLERWEDAVIAYERSLAIQPNADAYTNLGTTLYYLGREDESIAAFRRAAELTPTDPVGWGNLGNACHWFPGRKDEAGPALDRAIAIMLEQLARNSAEPECWARLGGWLANRGRLEEAGEAVRRALELAPDDVRSLVIAGHVYYQLGDRAECLRVLGAALAAGYGARELMRSRELAPLRADPEFRHLLEGRSSPLSATDETRCDGAA